MRERKYRAWDKKYKKMYYGDIRIVLAFPDEHIEIMDFIGSNDKNNVEIWEGDVVEGILNSTSFPIMGVIEYDEFWSAFGISNDAGFTMLFKISDIKITGDKFQNPELLNRGPD